MRLASTSSRTKAKRRNSENIGNWSVAIFRLLTWVQFDRFSTLISIFIERQPEKILNRERGERGERAEREKRGGEERGERAERREERGWAGRVRVRGREEGGETEKERDGGERRKRRGGETEKEETQILLKSTIMAILERQRTPLYQKNLSDTQLFFLHPFFLG